MVSGHEDRNQGQQADFADVNVVASTVSGQAGRNQVGMARSIDRTDVPQWCPAKKAGIRAREF